MTILSKFIGSKHEPYILCLFVPIFKFSFVWYLFQLPILQVCWRFTVNGKKYDKYEHKLIAMKGTVPIDKFPPIVL